MIENDWKWTYLIESTYAMIKFFDSSDAHNLLKPKATIIVDGLNTTARKGEKTGSTIYIMNLKNTRSQFE